MPYRLVTVRGNEDMRCFCEKERVASTLSGGRSRCAAELVNESVFATIVEAGREAVTETHREGGGSVSILGGRGVDGGIEPIARLDDCGE